MRRSIRSRGSLVTRWSGYFTGAGCSSGTRARWRGRAAPTTGFARVDGALRMSMKKVVLVNAAEPLPNLAFLI